MKVSRQSKNGGKGGAKVQKDSGVKGSTNASGSANECDGSETSNSEQVMPAHFASPTLALTHKWVHHRMECVGAFHA